MSVTLTATAASIVLVHGGFVDGSGWQGVYNILKKDGYSVSIVQNPTTSLGDDVAVTKRVIRGTGWPRDPRRPFVWRRGDHGSGNDPKVAALVQVTDSLYAFFADKSLESHVRPPTQGRDRVGSDSSRHDKRFGIVHDERRVFFIRAFD